MPIQYDMELTYNFWAGADVQEIVPVAYSQMPCKLCRLLQVDVPRTAEQPQMPEMPSKVFHGIILRHASLSGPVPAADP